jgi:hypothetical protein
MRQKTGRSTVATRFCGKKIINETARVRPQINTKSGFPNLPQRLPVSTQAQPLDQSVIAIAVVSATNAGRGKAQVGIQR